MILLSEGILTHDVTQEGIFASPGAVDFYGTLGRSYKAVF